MPEAKSAQSFVPVKEVRDGVIILKQGGYRGILMCSSVNFALKSEDERSGAKALYAASFVFFGILQFV
jgi:hypothetical protein